MIKNDKILIFLEYRKDLFRKYRNKQLSYYDVVSYSFQYIGQKKIKHIAKSHDLDGLFQNYWFWTIQIERKIANERDLRKYNASSTEFLKTAIAPLIEKRDLMVKRIIKENNINVLEAYIVFGDTIEINTELGLLYCSKAIYDKYIKIPSLKFGKSKNLEYIPYQNYHI